MYITQTYKYELNGVVYVSANLPEDAEVLETMDILNADDGYELIKNGESIGNSVWLRDGDSQENYAEVEIVEPEEETAEVEE